MNPNNAFCSSYFPQREEWGRGRSMKCPVLKLFRTSGEGI